MDHLCTYYLNNGIIPVKSVVNSIKIYDRYIHLTNLFLHNNNLSDDHIREILICKIGIMTYFLHHNNALINDMNNKYDREYYYNILFPKLNDYKPDSIEYNRYKITEFTNIYFLLKNAISYNSVTLAKIINSLWTILYHDYNYILINNNVGKDIELNLKLLQQLYSVDYSNIFDINNKNEEYIAHFNNKYDSSMNIFFNFINFDFMTSGLFTSNHSKQKYSFNDTTKFAYYTEGICKMLDYFINYDILEYIINHTISMTSSNVYNCIKIILYTILYRDMYNFLNINEKPLEYNRLTLINNININKKHSHHKSKEYNSNLSILYTKLSTLKINSFIYSEVIVNYAYTIIANNNVFKKMLTDKFLNSNIEMSYTDIYDNQTTEIDNNKYFYQLINTNTIANIYILKHILININLYLPNGITDLNRVYLCNKPLISYFIILENLGLYFYKMITDIIFQNSNYIKLYANILSNLNLDKYILIEYINITNKDTYDFVVEYLNIKNNKENINILLESLVNKVSKLNISPNAYELLNDTNETSYMLYNILGIIYKLKSNFNINPNNYFTKNNNFILFLSNLQKIIDSKPNTFKDFMIHIIYFYINYMLLDQNNSITNIYYNDTLHYDMFKNLTNNLSPSIKEKFNKYIYIILLEQNYINDIQYQDNINILFKIYDGYNDNEHTQQILENINSNFDIKINIINMILLSLVVNINTPK